MHTVDFSDVLFAMWNVEVMLCSRCIQISLLVPAASLVIHWHNAADSDQWSDVVNWKDVFS